MDGANHVVPPHEECSPDNTKDKCAPERANKSFNSLLWREGDQRGSAEELAPNVCEDVVADDERCWNPKPDQTFENVVDDEVTSRNEPVE